MPCGTLVTLCCAAGHFVHALTEMRAQAGTRGYSWVPSIARVLMSTVDCEGKADGHPQGPRSLCRCATERLMLRHRPTATPIRYPQQQKATAAAGHLIGSCRRLPMRTLPMRGVATQATCSAGRCQRIIVEHTRRRWPRGCLCLPSALCATSANSIRSVHWSTKSALSSHG